MVFFLPQWAKVSFLVGEEDLACARKKGHPFDQSLNLEDKDPFSNDRPQSVKPQIPKRKDELQVLPVDSYRGLIISHVQNYSVVLVRSETGSGKSTRIPQMVLDDQISHNIPCRIVVAEQRRLSAIRLAERVAWERGENLCKERTASVGYAVRQNFMLARSLFGLTYVTEKILLNRLAQGSFSHVFLDEVHEHTLDTDLLLKILRDLIKNGAPLKVVLMSATVGVADKFRKYFAGVSFYDFYVPSGTHDYRRYFADEQRETMKHWKKPADVIVEAVSWCLCKEKEGDMLVFLSGWQEIRDCSKALESKQDIALCQLHSHATSGPVFDSVAQRKVILSTNIAESSITVPGVVFVIDFCKEKIQVRTGLDTQRIAMTSAVQRAGRSGRTRPGKCLTMVSRQIFEQLSPERMPEIQRASLCSAIMYILRMGFVDNTYGSELKCFLEAMIHTPRLNDLKEDVKKLEMLGLTVQGHLTSLGEVVSNYSFTPEVSIALCAGAMLGVGQHVALVLAGTTNGNFRQCLFRQSGLSKFVTSENSELFASATFLKGCFENPCLWEGNTQVLSDIYDCYQDMCNAVKEMGAFENSSTQCFEEQWSLIDFALICGFRKQVAMPCLARGTYVDGDNVFHHINPKSVIEDPRRSGVYFVESFNKHLYGVSPCRPLSLLAFGGSDIEGQPNNHVCLGEFVDLRLHWETCPDLLNLRLVFDHLLNRFCEGTASGEEIQNMVKLLSANTDIASSSLWRMRKTSGVTVSIGTRNGTVNIAVQRKPDLQNQPATVVPSSSLDYVTLEKDENAWSNSAGKKKRKGSSLFLGNEGGLQRKKYDHPYVIPRTARTDADKVVQYLEQYWSDFS